MKQNSAVDSENLMNVCLPFAEQMLSEHGEFIPFGAKMLASGEIISVAGSTGEEHPRSQDVIDVLRTAYVSEAATGGIIATAVIYDIRVTPPGATLPQGAVALALDHHDGYSVTVIFPYTIDGQQVSFKPLR